MKRLTHILSAVILYAFSCTVSFAGESFSRYRLILERRPFGSVAADDEESQKNVVTLVKPPAFVKDLRMCAITESPAGLKVGFVNIRKKPPYPYYLYVGDSEDGIELVDASYEDESALLRKGGEQFWMYMGATPAAGDHAKTQSSPKSSPVSRGIRPSSPGTQFKGAYAERRRRRLEEMRKREEEARKLSEAEVQKKLEEYQMDLIRKGLTPLPMKLTEEMDRKLVEEGVLPALDE